MSEALGFDLIVPGLTLRLDDTHPDWPAMDQLVRQAAQATAVDQFILSGTTTRGDLLSVLDRAKTLDIWLSELPPSRLMATCWCPRDIAKAIELGVTPLVVLRNINERSQLLAFLRDLPAGAFVYSHPLHSPCLLDPPSASAALEAGHMPAGSKLAKVSLPTIGAMREIVGEDFVLWDASSRRMSQSVLAGASGVVATPLATMASVNGTAVSVDAVQDSINSIQLRLDSLPDRKARTRFLYNELRSNLRPRNDTG
jgi:hypothetical protein